MSYYVWGSKMSYADYLTAKSFISDVSMATKTAGRQVSMEISRQTRDVIASNEAMARDNIRAIEANTDAMNAGFDRLSYGLSEISSGISDLQLLKSKLRQERLQNRLKKNKLYKEYVSTLKMEWVHKRQQWISALYQRVLTITEVTANTYAKIRLALKKKGRPIPENDLWIAAICIEHKLPLMSSDSHFEYIDQLNLMSI